MKKNSNRFEIFVSVLSVAFLFFMLYLLVASFIPERRNRDSRYTTAYQSTVQRTTSASTTAEPTTKAPETYTTRHYTYRTTEPTTSKVYTTSYRYRIRHTEPQSDPYNAKDFRDEEDFYDWYFDDFYDFEDAEDYWRDHHDM